MEIEEMGGKTNLFLLEQFKENKYSYVIWMTWIRIPKILADIIAVFNYGVRLVLNSLIKFL